MSSLHKRLSISGRDARSPGASGPQSPGAVMLLSPPEPEEWTRHWERVLARDLVDHDVVTVDAETSVEDACEKLLSSEIACVAVQTSEEEDLAGLFDFADVNAFLTLAATRHTLSPEELKHNTRADAILSAAKAGKVPVKLVSNLSEKNALETLPYDATLLSLLGVFSRGVHRVLIRSESAAVGKPYLGFVSDGSALTHLATHAEQDSTLSPFLGNALGALELPSLHLGTSVVSASASASVLDAMRLMSEEGVSSIAVLEDPAGTLLSAVSVTDIGKVVVPQQSNQILTMPLHQLVSVIRAPLGSTDGEERYPVYSVAPENMLSYTIQKILATNSHRLFVTDNAPFASPHPVGNLCGVVSIVDILALFARLANVPGVDPLRMQRHRRMSSSSSRSNGSRSSSRTGVRQRVNSQSLSPLLMPVGAPALSTSPRSGIPLPGTSPQGHGRQKRGSVASLDGVLGGGPAS